MTALLDVTAELPVWVLVLAAVIFFLLGRGSKRELADGCATCRKNADRHDRRTERPAWPGWPGHHAGQVPFPYGDQIKLARLDDEPWEQLPSRIPAPPDDDTLAGWLTKPEAQSWPPLDREGLLVEKLITQLEHLEDDTHVMEMA